MEALDYIEAVDNNYDIDPGIVATSDEGVVPENPT